MATKTISLRLEAYEKLKRARRYRDESFSEVVLRARWPEESTTGAAPHLGHEGRISEREGRISIMEL